MFQLRALRRLLTTVVAVTFFTVPPAVEAGDGKKRADLEGTDNSVQIFPTYGVMSPDGKSVRIPMRVWVHEREDDRVRRFAIEKLAGELGISEGTHAYEIFKRRMLAFMVDNESGEEVFARPVGLGIGPRQEQLVGVTGKNGHASTLLEFAYQLPRDPARRDLKVQVRVEGDTVGNEPLEVPIVEAEGVTVVSDIDDTIKITNVVDRREMFANTFTREFVAVPGMAEQYRQWAAQGAKFHYVSASPWSLQTDLSQLLERERFPAGVYHLRILRLKELRKTYEFAKGSGPHKIESIETLFEQFPQRSFILVGDTGERDPEIYAELAKRFPERVQHMYLRRVEGADNKPERFEQTFADIPASKWTVFSDPEALQPLGDGPGVKR